MLTFRLTDEFLQKDGDPVRKSLLVILVLFLTLICACAIADTEYSLAPLSGKIAFNQERYVVLTPSNLGEHPDLIAQIGTTQEALTADMTARNVILLAWAKDMKTCVEVSVFQDDDSNEYYDLELKDSAGRRQYYNAQITALKKQGYIINSSEIKLHKNSGHYVVFDYLRKDGEVQHRGIGRKIVRNGYTMFLDYQVFDRKPTKTDQDRSRAIVNTIVIDKAKAPSKSDSKTTVKSSSSKKAPSGAAAMLKVTTKPPVKTNTDTFTIEGTAYPGSEVIIVAMRMSNNNVKRFTTTATAKGNFKTKVTLPDEGIYNFTLTNYTGKTEIGESYLGQTQYSKNLLPYSLDKEIPAKLTSDELVISGTTDKGVTIQCLVTNGKTTFDKTVRTNGTGKFRFKVPTKEATDYSIVLSFSKKGLNNERLERKTTRKLSDKDKQSRTAAKAKRVSYNALVKKLDTYVGETIVYEAHIVSVEKNGDEWFITAALKLNKGKYSNFLIYSAKEDPGLASGSKVKMYGKCIGPHQIQSEEGNTSYPAFDFLFFE